MGHPISIPRIQELLQLLRTNQPSTNTLCLLKNTPKLQTATHTKHRILKATSCQALLSVSMHSPCRLSKEKATVSFLLLSLPRWSFSLTTFLIQAQHQGQQQKIFFPPSIKGFNGRVKYTYSSVSSTFNHKNSSYL